MKKVISILVFSLVVLATSQVSAQLLATSMRITVMSSMGNLVENAKVTVYANQEDYENEENAVAGPAFTDAKGRVTFKNLDEKEYYVQVISGDKNNYGDAERTSKLIKGKLNKFNIVVQ